MGFVVMARRKDPVFVLAGVAGRLLSGRKRGWGIFILILLVLFVFLRPLYQERFPEASGENIEGVVVHVADGDTLTVRTGTFGHFRKEKVRLYGIDAPEMNQAYGLESKEWLMSHVMGRSVKVEQENRDQYGRLVGKVYAGDKYINLGAVQAGMAWYYKQYASGETDLARAEIMARNNRNGLWRQKSPEAPWKYRNRNKNK